MKKLDLDGDAWTTEIKAFCEAIRHRRKAIAASRGFSEEDEVLPEPPLTTPIVPAYPGSGLQYHGFGADLALELCKNSLSLLQPDVRSTIEKVVATSYRVPIRVAVDYAKGAELIPLEDKMSTE